MKKQKKLLNNIKKHKLKYLLIFVFVIAIVLSLYFIIKPFNKKDLQDDTAIPNEVVEPIPVNELKGKISEMQEVNKDVKGWIKVGKTVVDYPLLQGTDNDYYLKHNYKKKNDGWGEIFIHHKSNLEDVNSNVIIYGHNNGGKKSITKMFSTLQLYNDKEHYENNKTITITTLEEEKVYEIFAVFKSRIFYQDETNVFRYYNYIDLKDKKVFEEYIQNVSKIALYDTGIKPEYGEQLITLITCDYTQENGRFVVVARKKAN